MASSEKSKRLDGDQSILKHKNKNASDFGNPNPRIRNNDFFDDDDDDDWSLESALFYKKQHLESYIRELFTAPEYVLEGIPSSLLVNEALKQPAYLAYVDQIVEAATAHLVIPVNTHASPLPKPINNPQQPPWERIHSNLFLHRLRKTRTSEEVVICDCNPPPPTFMNGGLCCGAECLNRLANIECVQGTCPGGDRCSNQQFQKRKYAKLEPFPCRNNKGYGLRLLQTVSPGDFLIEYVGEVLDPKACEARQREYVSKGHNHFYFMTLYGGEVIDSCAKGNLGRFINHSCDPNCRAEKWMVNGEMCIGFFAIRNIKQGEEVTFDYDSVHAAAAAKKCLCGSSNCRGYIGASPLNTGALVQARSGGPSVNSYPSNGSKTRKRKSCWDQPKEGSSRLQSRKLMGDKNAKRDFILSLQQPEIREAVQEQERVDDDDTPSGFPSILVPYDASSAATSSGIHRRNCSHEVVTECNQDGKSHRASHHSSHHQPDAAIPCTLGTRPPDVAYNQKVERMRSSSENCGTRYLKHQKQTHASCTWGRNRTGWY